jgi:hypothetical protein
MKKKHLFFVIIMAIFFNSCEDVVTLDLNTAPPKLVIEATINWYKGTSGNEQKIKLTTTTDYYSNVIPKVSGATVYVKNSTNTTFNFTENPNTGEYFCTTFIPVINETYTLTVISNGQTYTATETLKPVAPITKIVQNNLGGFDGKTIEIKAYFNDPATEENYYLFGYKYQNPLVDNYYAGEDTFFQGNEFFSASQNDELKAGDKIGITHFGISKTYSNYIKVLVSIAGSGNGAPFQSPAATVRGNIINTTNFDNYALGYFSVSEADIKNYNVQ